MADRVAVFSMGELQQYDTPEVLYHRPKNTFVAGFVGSPPMNLIEGEFTGDGFRAGELRLPIPGAPTGKGWLGVRPEHLALGEEGHPARVLVVEPLGREVLVVAEVGGVRLQVLLPEEARPGMGEEVGVVFPQRELHFFDEKGRRIGPE